MMIITPERYATALTPEQYIETMDENRSLFEANLAATHVSDDERAFFGSLPRPLEVLVLTEDWCGDSAANLPMVVRLARETGKLNLRILRRAGNEDIADRYQLADGRNHIPTYIVLDEHLDELGNVIERPASITEKLDAHKAAWFAEFSEVGDATTAIGAMEPEARTTFLAARRAVREQYRDLERRDLFAALRAIAARSLAHA